MVLVLLHLVENWSNIKILFSCQCKEWGFLLREMFGNSLGTGDYGHLTVEHVLMLFRSHRSLHDLSNQGFEAAHKLQRQLYARATSHDSAGNTSSCKFFQSQSKLVCNHNQLLQHNSCTSINVEAQWCTD